MAGTKVKTRQKDCHSFSLIATKNSRLKLDLITLILPKRLDIALFTILYPLNTWMHFKSKII
jgi:hypothetical protein